MNSRPAITKRSSYTVRPLSSRSPKASPAADEAQNFHPIARFETADLEVLPIEDFRFNSTATRSVLISSSRSRSPWMVDLTGNRAAGR